MEKTGAITKDTPSENDSAPEKNAADLYEAKAEHVTQRAADAAQSAMQGKCCGGGCQK
jgi:hypothetical protein